MRDRLVEVLARDVAGKALRVADEDPALAVALAQHHRLGDGALGAYEARRARHDLGRGRSGRAAPEAPRTSSRASASGPRCTAEAACWMAAAPERGRDRRGVELGERVRTTQKTRPSISTRQTSASASVRSTILWARFETPST